MAEKPSKSSRGAEIVPLPKNRSRSESVGEALRRQYRDIVDEPIPDRLQKMIEALREKEQKEGQQD